MHGIATIAKLNREHAEAAEIMAKHADADAAKARAQSTAPHLPKTAATGTINRILNGARG